MPQARLLVFDGAEEPRVLPLGEGPVTIGRDAQNNLVVKEITVSRQHARVFVRDGKYFIADLSSTHGTQVNGNKVSRKEILSGDELLLGKCRLQFELIEEQAASPASPAAPASDEDEDEFQLEMPDELLPKKPAAASGGDSEAPLETGRTVEDEDPFAEERTSSVTGASATGAPEHTIATHSDAVSSEPTARPANVGSRNRPRRGAASKGGGSALMRQDLDQRGPLFRLVAVLVALAAAGGLGYLAMQVMSLGDGEEVVESATPNEQSRGPNRPTRPR